jgi:hypothetical protein
MQLLGSGESLIIFITWNSLVWKRELRGGRRIYFFYVLLGDIIPKILGLRNDLIF